ncbi:MAG: transcription-repair coupling factor [Aestuariivita sp.]|nr:transcription-repair coupling factor [Aestuariivita sp.]MCY4201074.1 transcription-repair coupling factor [Aestuariivita sp.]
MNSVNVLKTRPVPAASLRHVIVSGAPSGFDARLVLEELAASKRPVLHIARDDTRLEEMVDALAFFDPAVPIITFPAWDCLPYDKISPNPQISAHRMAALAMLCQKDQDPGFVVIATLNAATQRVPPRDFVRESIFPLKVGHQVDIEDLKEFLVASGFLPAATVIEPGDFAVRGGIIDIYPPGNTGPIRLDFFGDVLESLRRFAPVDQRTIEKLDALQLIAATEVPFDTTSIERFRRNYRGAFGGLISEDPLYESVSARCKYHGMEHWLPFFHEHLETIFDYLPDATITMDEGSDRDRENRWHIIMSQYESRHQSSEDHAELNPSYRTINPSLLYLDNIAWDNLTATRRLLRLASTPSPTGPNVIDIGGRIGRRFSSEQKLKKTNLFRLLAEFIEEKLDGGPIVIASYSEGARERLAGLLADEGLAEARMIANAKELARSGLHLTVWPLEHGFKTDDLTVISEQDILGERLIRKPRKNRRAESFIDEVQSLHADDLVVHIDHGIGQYLGLEVVQVSGAAHECLAIAYANEAKLYLPVENIELLTRYGGSDSSLDRLGGAGWQARKARLKDRIRAIAHKLIQVAAIRELRPAPKAEVEHHLWEEFLARFPYQETEDQRQAINDVLNDLARGTPMDRLICGDVGYGKTEVAMRAAFVAAMSGLQVAVITPTTLLSRQHFVSFSERFADFSVDVRQLSRFVPNQQTRETREGLADGTVDIVIGTHAIFSKTVKFKRLGLLVIDEEQHFGVVHKERLKQLQAEIHVLTLTATPIPRTLQLGLSGLRDLSVIGTPPIDRLAIRTYVSTFDPVTVREALLRERYRGGQSFFVVPRISDLPAIERFLHNDVPEVSYVVAHGQMKTTDLDNRMMAFYDGRYDILLSTSIIESGLDIPSANTIVIYGAEKFGLAQLYQIRGRVGRSKLRAYAYLTTKPKANLTEDAQKRLKVLGSIDTLGAGFALASRDLEIRGAGNLLGDEQTGQIREVGYELYQEMLSKAIRAIREDEGDRSTADDDWTPRINLGVPVLIPASYIPNLDVRMGLYRRLSRLRDKTDLEGFAAELIDRFGKLPREINFLLLIIHLKMLCRRAGILKLSGGQGGATIRFQKGYHPSAERMAEYLRDQRGQATVRDEKLVVTAQWAKESERVKGAVAIVRDLARL